MSNATRPPDGEEWKSLGAAARIYQPESHAADIDAARSRIRDIRQQDVVVEVRDRAGQPVVGLQVEVVQTRSAFPWGEQLWGLDTLFRNGYGNSAKVRHYTRRFTGCLNSANCLSYWTEAPRNDGPKHMEFQGEDALDGMEAQVDWAMQNGLTPKGHPVFWSIPKAYPEWLKRYPFDTQWKFVEVRVRNLISRFKGRVKIWDLVNEPLWEAAPKNLSSRSWPHVESLGDLCEYILPILRWAREEDPDAKYLINDYGLEMDMPGLNLQDRAGRPVTAKSQRQRFVELFRRLADEGASPDGLGMQAHTGAWFDPAGQNMVLDELAAAGVPLHYTEFWAKTDHLLKAGVSPRAAEELKAEYIANVMTVAFAHPAVESFFFWGDINESFGFRDDHNSHGLPSSSHEPGPTYWKVHDLVTREWMTRQKLVTDESGAIRFRGFLGDYALRYETRSGMVCGENFVLDRKRSGPVRMEVHPGICRP